MKHDVPGFASLGAFSISIPTKHKNMSSLLSSLQLDLVNPSLVLVELNSTKLH